jgi:hypothetical protein
MQDLHANSNSTLPNNTSSYVKQKREQRPALYEPKHKRNRDDEYSMNQVRKREMSANPEYSIKYKVLIRAHQDLILERSKKQI